MIRSTGVAVTSALLGTISPAPLVRRLPSGFSYATWMEPAALDVASRDRLYESAAWLATQAFGADQTPFWEAQKQKDYFGTASRFFLMFDDEQRLMGWGGYHRRRFAGEHCLYIDSSGVLAPY